VQGKRLGVEPAARTGHAILIVMLSAAAPAFKPAYTSHSDKTNQINANNQARFRHARSAAPPVESRHQRRRKQQQIGEAAYRCGTLGQLRKYSCDEIPPSSESKGAWLYCCDKSGRREPSLTDRGSWLLFSPQCAVDSDWLIIRMATLSGELGCSAKVSTAVSAHSNTKETRLICVESAAEPAERLRVLDRLRKLGWRLDLQFKLRRESEGLVFHTPTEGIWVRGELAGEWWAADCDEKRPMYLLPTGVSSSIVQVLQHVIIPFVPALVAVCKAWASTSFSARRMRAALRRTCPWKCASPACSFCSPPAHFTVIQLRRLYATGDLPEEEGVPEGESTAAGVAEITAGAGAC
jgi:hypothetical protein